VLAILDNTSPTFYV